MTQPQPTDLTDRDIEFAHDYLSTACWHNLHTECRRTCKFCLADCLCGCHRKRESEPC